MKKRFSYSVKGIKCDACTYSDMSVPQEDYPNWLNKPCPECGANLLTEADFNALKKLTTMTNFLNRLFPVKKSDVENIGEPIVFHGESNGTGVIDFKQVEPDLKK